MASTPVRLRAPSGLTLTAKMFALNGDSVLNGGGSGNACTEATNHKTRYDFTVTEALAGFYSVVAFSGSTPIADGIVYVEDTNTQRYVQDDMSMALATLDNKTLQQTLRYVAAMVAGKCSGAGTGTETFVGLDGSTNRVTMTISGSNRTAASYDP